MLHVFTPKGLLNKISNLLTDNDEMAIVGLNGNEVIAINKIDGDDIFVQDNISSYVILRGARTKKSDNYVDDFQSLLRHLVCLDMLVYDVDTKKFYSDLCDEPVACCGPDNMISYVD